MYCPRLSTSQPAPRATRSTGLLVPRYIQRPRQQMGDALFRLALWSFRVPRHTHTDLTRQMGAGRLAPHSEGIVAFVNEAAFAEPRWPCGCRIGTTFPEQRVAVGRRRARAYQPAADRHTAGRSRIIRVATAAGARPDEETYQRSVRRRQAVLGNRAGERPTKPPRAGFRERFASSTVTELGPLSRAYRPYKRQRPGGSIDAVYRNLVRARICYIGELSGGTDGDRGRR